ncbi:MAG TPA: hypothetical protein VNN08_03760 [Thermoanaerobaculia bacterium]|nr:hypothetical protein [Thermoanaerobaculia bacterium]
MNESESERKLSKFEYIQILLHEYDTLRNEIIGRTRDGFNLIAITAALLFGALSLFYGPAGAWPAIAVAVLSVGVFFFAAHETFFRISLAATRIRELETRVNSLAGERLLSWEAESGAAGHGWFIQGWRHQKP